MPSVAEQLRATREARKLTIHQLADVTKIKTEHIRALEQGDFSPFSAPVYIKGHVKALGRALDLELPALLRELEAELAQTRKFAGPPSLMPGNKGVLDWVMLQVSKMQLQVFAPFLAFAALVVLSLWAYTAWRRAEARDPLSELGPGLYQPPPSPQGGQYLPIPPQATNSAPLR